MVIHAIKAAQPKPSPPSPSASPIPSDHHNESKAEGESTDITVNESSNTITLKAVDDTSAGDNLTFLKSELRWTVGEDGEERVVDGDGNGLVVVRFPTHLRENYALQTEIDSQICVIPGRVMMGWERPLMEAHVKLLKKSLKDKIADGDPISVLNIGYGLGIVSRITLAPQLFRLCPPLKIDNLLQTLLPTPPTHHTIIEAHPTVLNHLRTVHKFDEKPGVTVLEGRWQDYLCAPGPSGNERVGEVLKGSEGEGGFDFVFMDTFAEGYEGECCSSPISMSISTIKDVRAHGLVADSGRDSVFCLAG